MVPRGDLVVGPIIRNMLGKAEPISSVQIAAGIVEYVTMARGFNVRWHNGLEQDDI